MDPELGASGAASSQIGRLSTPQIESPEESMAGVLPGTDGDNPAAEHSGASPSGVSVEGDTDGSHDQPDQGPLSDSALDTVMDCNVPSNGDFNLEVEQHISKKRKLSEVGDSEARDEQITIDDLVAGHDDEQDPKTNDDCRTSGEKSAEESTLETVPIVTQVAPPTAVEIKKAHEKIEYGAALEKQYKKLHGSMLNDLRKVMYLAQTSSSDNKPIDIEELKPLLEHLKLVATVRMEKYNKATEKKRSPSNKVRHPQTTLEITQRLQGEEENRHGWLPTPALIKKLPKYVFRAFHDNSQSRVADARVGLQSRKSYGNLKTADERKFALANHKDWSNKNLSPFISTSSSLPHLFENFMDCFNDKYKVKGNPDNTKVVMINVNARVAAKQPIFSMVDELMHYKVPLGSGKLFDAEYPCPYQIGPEEIICTWTVDEMEAWMDDFKKANNLNIRKRKIDEVYYEKARRMKDTKVAAAAFQKMVAKPAFKKHEQARLAAPSN